MDIMNAAVSGGLNQAVRASSPAIWSPKGPLPAVHQALVWSGHFLQTYYSDEDGAAGSLRPGGFFGVGHIAQEHWFLHDNSASQCRNAFFSSILRNVNGQASLRKSS